MMRKQKKFSEETLLFLRGHGKINHIIVGSKKMDWIQNGRGAGFISKMHTMAGQPCHLKGETAEGYQRPDLIFWGDAEYVAHCHRCGALSLVRKNIQKDETPLSHERSPEGVSVHGIFYS